ncbi:MAG TPA: gas vesicle protein GvpG [Chloroflexota bacterium]
MLFKLLGAPFSLPGAGMRFVFNTIADLADQELNDESVLREQFLLLQVQLEEGDIDDDEYVEQEAVLLARLREIKARKRAQVEQVEPGEMPAEANVAARRRVVVETPFDE